MKLISFLSTFLICSHLFCNWNQVPQLTLQAHAILKKPADQIQFCIHVVSNQETAQEALLNNSNRMNQIIHVLKEQGLKSENYETSQFQLNPTYTPCPQHPPINWRPSINGYEVHNSLHIHTQSIDLVGNWIDLATRLGADKISDIQFTLLNPEKFSQEALVKAGSKALQDAEILAENMRVKIKRVLSINVNQMRVHSSQVPIACFAKNMAHDAAPSLEPGDLSIDVSVHVVFEIDSL